MEGKLEANAFELEEETREKVSHSLSKIEVALADWEACKKKPAGLEGKVKVLRASYELLSEWEKKSLKGRKDFISTVKRLRGFTEICAKLRKMETG